MSNKKSSKFGRIRAGFVGFLVLISMFIGVGGGFLNNDAVYAVNGNEDTTEETTNTETEENTEENTTNDSSTDADDEEGTKNRTRGSTDSCKDSLGALGWLVCPTTGKIAEAVDWLYEKIEDILVIQPISTEDGTPIYEIWKYCLGLTNIVFIIFLLVVIYSQITGVGISNYGIKKALPKLIIAAIMVNLSFLICLLAVDVSNIVGNSLRGLFTSIEESAMASSSMQAGSMSYAGAYSSLAGGTALAVGGAVIAFEAGAIWMLIPVVLGAIVAVASGLITIALRQAVVVLLVMISPLAIVASILPNTEKWFKKWKDLLTKMLVFYPMFSLLFGAASLAGFAIIMSAGDGFGVLLGMAVQIFPLFFSWKLMQMSGTFLGDINTKMRGLASRPLATNRAWADSHRLNTKQKYLASNRPITPSLALMQFIGNRRVAREADIDENAKMARDRGLAYRAGRNFKGPGATGEPTRRGEKVYEQMAQGLEYQRIIERDKNTMNKGLGYLAAEGTTKRARLDRLDAKMVNAADMLKVEQARGEKIEYENAAGFHKRMEAAVNAHMDDVNGFKFDKDGNKVKRKDYKFHLDPNDPEQTAQLVKYNTIHQIMEGSDADVQFAAATAAQGYDTQKKMYEAKMQKYFEMAPPTKDVVYRMNELTRQEGAASNIDAIVAGMRVLNQRGDTDLVKEQLDNILDAKLGGGIELGTHASQALASFLMFEVKGGDPALRRFGKYINLETARAYNSNDRQEQYVTYDEYIKGYHIEPDGSKMYAKKDSKKLLEGTSLDDIERTALSNLDDSLKQAYGFDKNNKKKDWDVSGYLKRREEIQTAFEPAFLSSSLKWLSGSEQINSAVKFWTGYELKQKKDEDGKLLIDKDGNPEYDLMPVWEEKEFAAHKDEVEKYYRRKTGDYFKDQTTGQILNMRTDYRDPTMRHMLETYLKGTGDEKELTEEQKQEYSKRRAEYEKRKAEIQTRYGDKSLDEAEKLRKKDLKALDMEFAGRQVRKILGETGKLKQIYRTRTSGTAINAKDWLRKWVNLDDEDALLKEKNYYDKKMKDEKKLKEEENRKGADPEAEAGSQGRVYGDEDRENFVNEMRDLKDKIADEETEMFFEDTRSQLEEWFGENTVMVKKYEKYYQKDNPYADNIDLYKYLLELLDDLDNYPDA